MSKATKTSIDDDLLSAYDRPERSVTDCSSLLDLHLQVVIFAQLWRQTRLATEGASLAEITPTIELYRSQLENIVMNLASMKYVEVPPPFGSYRGTVRWQSLAKMSYAKLLPLRRSHQCHQTISGIGGNTSVPASVTVRTEENVSIPLRC